MTGNGFSGPLGNDNVLNASKLRYVSLSNNQITGSLPVSMQEFGKFELFDVSTNKISGTLSRTFSMYGGERDYQLAVNRLSGPFPLIDNITALSTSNVKSSFLEGNTFQFEFYQVPIGIF